MEKEKRMETQKLQVKCDVKVTPDTIDDILDSAMYGIGYWCEEAKVVGEFLGEYTSEQISHGGEIKFTLLEPFDDDDTEEYTLDFEKMMKGIKMFLEELACAAEYIDDGFLDAGCIDSVAADVIVQYGLFDEVVYG